MAADVAQNIIDALSVGSLYAITATGIALVFGIMQLINFAYGELITLGAYALLAVSGIPIYIAVLVPLAVAAVAAVLMERTAFRPVRGADPSTLLVTSFALSVLIQSAIVLGVTSLPRGVALPSTFIESIRIADVRIPVLSLITIAVSVLIFLALGLFLQRTNSGMEMRAAAENFQMARLLGVAANRVIARAFFISGLLAGVVSFLWVAKTGTVTPDMGLAPLLVGVIAAVLGGLRSLVGAVLGGYLLGAITIGLQAGLPTSFGPYRDALVFAGAVLVLLVRPDGLVRGRMGEAARV